MDEVVWIEVSSGKICYVYFKNHTYITSFYIDRYESNNDIIPSLRPPQEERLFAVASPETQIENITWKKFCELGKKLVEEHRAAGHQVWYHNRGPYDYHFECYTCHPRATRNNAGK